MNLKWLPRFRVVTILSVMTCLSVFLSVNAIPVQKEGSIHFYTHGRFTILEECYGWPYIYSRKLIGGNVPQELLPIGSRDYYSLRPREQYHLFDNLAITLFCSFVVAIIFEMTVRKWATEKKTTSYSPNNGISVG